MKMNAGKDSAGFGLIEVLVSMVILALSILFISRNMTALSKQQVANEKKQRAEFYCHETQEEVKNLLGRTNVISNVDFSLYEDYDELNSTSSTAGHRTFKSYKTISSMFSSVTVQTDYRRQINFFRIPTVPNALRMRVRIYDYNTPELLAETLTIVHFKQKLTDPVQVHRIYDIGIWKELGDTAKYPIPTSPQAVLDTKPILPAGVGRDPFYRPLNLKHNSPASDLTYSSGANDYVYMNNQKPLVGPFNDDKVDQFNHAARGPDEEQKIPTLRENPTLRYLLNQMWSKDPDFQNLILLNSGPMLRVPPLRNYSDAAKNPATLPFVRAVTHPEKIGVNSGQEVRLRVYPYSMKPDAASATVLLSTVTVVLDQAISAGDIQINKMVGNESLMYQWMSVPADVDITTYSTYTVIALYRSSLQHQQHPASGTGLSVGARLYGLEYIPCLVTTPPDPLPATYVFPTGDHDLSDSAHPSEAKNTARWMIRLAPGSVSNGTLKIETRLGDNLNSGTPTFQPVNISRTYVWVGTPVPLTEQFQLLGDARHSPYADVKARHGYNWYFNQVAGNGYSGFNKTAPGWTYAHTYPSTTLATPQRVNFDVPRYFYLIREALLNSHSVFVAGDASLEDNEDAVPLAYLVLGGEIMFEWTKSGAAPFRTKTTAWEPGSSFAPSTTSDGVLEISNGAGRTNLREANMRIVARTDNSWMSMPWLGELYPDDVYSQWTTGWSFGLGSGNLPAGVGKYYRAPYSVFSSTFSLPAGTNFSNQIAGAGLATLINGNAAGSGDTFAYGPFLPAQTATFTAEWKALENAFNFYLGRNDDKTTSRFRLDETDATLMPPANTDMIYRAARTRSSMIDSYMTPSVPGSFPNVSGIIRLEDPSDASRVAHVVVNGNINEDWGYELGKAQDAVLGVSGFWESASPSIALSGRVQPIPRVEFSSPVGDQKIKTTTLSVSWVTQWVRWDGEPYSNHFPVGFSNSDPLIFNLVYTKGKVGTMWGSVLWYDAFSHGPAGTSRSTANGATSGLTWNVSSLPAGIYTLRIEAYGQFGPHKAYHDCQIEIE
jgi:type II secretory pathway pseudopilin PulG